jgi:hypothetical protein
MTRLLIIGILPDGDAPTQARSHVASAAHGNSASASQTFKRVLVPRTGYSQLVAESLDNLTPANVCFGRAETILLERKRIKRLTPAFDFALGLRAIGAPRTGSIFC